MDKEEWNKFCQVFNLDVEVKVPKKVTRNDILLTLLNEGEFIFKHSDNTHTCMNLRNLKGKATKEQIKAFRDILWNPIEDYLRCRNLN